MQQFEQLGPYKIGKRIGAGGMGHVYEAVHTETGEAAAVKVLSPALAMSEGFRERFEAEIESLRKLRHPHIVELYGFGEQDGFLFYAMELVKGSSLETELNSGRRFYWREVTRIAIMISKALKHAHDHGIIHRDLKPANLLLTEDEEIKLLDFGIARLFGGNNLTSAGGVLGTADFMSPEQADGRPVTDRCDQYSLGCVLYALATGRQPFRAPTLPALLQLQRFAQPEPPRRYSPEIPEELERIILQLMEKEPEKRFPNTAIVARRLSAMERALSRPFAEDDFHLTGDAPPPAASDPAAAVFETRFAAAREAAISNVTQDLSTQAGDATSVTAAEIAEDKPRATRFTSIAEELQRERQRQEESWLPAILQLSAIAAMLAIAAALVWYFTRPPSADVLFAKIQNAASEEGVEKLFDVDDEIKQFIARFPDDPRAKEVATYQEEIELARTDRRLWARTRPTSKSQALAPIERMYVEAIRQVKFNPEQAMAELTALVDLYKGDPDLEPVEERCLTLAERQLVLLSEQVYRYAPDQVAALQQRLKRAEQIAKTDPEKAQKIWWGILALCQNKPWATDIVEQAKAGLAASTGGVAQDVTSETKQP